MSKHTAVINGEVMMTGKGVLLLILISPDDDGRKVRLGKQIVANQLVVNGLGADELQTYLGNVRYLAKSTKPLDQLLGLIATLQNDKAKAEPFIEWLYAKGYWGNDDSTQMLAEVASR